MTPEAKQMYIEAKTVSQNVTLQLEEMRQSISTLSMEDLVDTVYALREVVAYYNEVKKEVEKLRATAAKVGVIHCDARVIDKVQTKYCTGKPKEDSIFLYPNKRDKDPEAFDTLMIDLGIPKEVASKELVRVHWPEFQKHCQELISNAKNPPGGIRPDETSAVYDFSIIKRRGVSIDTPTESKPTATQEGKYTKQEETVTEELF